MTAVDAGQCAISIDVDEILHYHRIHGLPSEPTGSPAWSRGVPRYLELLEAHDIKGTFFVVGEDLKGGAGREMAEEIHRRGHELASHSYSHRYDLVRLETDTMRSEVRDAAEIIATITGATPAGFRAPGYTVTAPLLREVAEAGHSYDASVFPCPPYLFAKWAVKATMALRGRTSHSIWGDWRVMGARPQPYWIADHPYRPRAETDATLLELPIAVSAYLRMPLIGTSMLMFGSDWVRRQRQRLRRRRPILNLEFHAVDLMGIEEDQLDRALEVQPDLARLNVAQKRQRMETLFADLATHYRFATLGEIAQAAQGADL